LSSIINASNSGFGGVVTTGDSSGILALQTAGTTALTLDTSQNATFAGKVTSAGALTLASNGTTTAVTIDTSQNVGIGTTSPAFKFETQGTGQNTLVVRSTSTGLYDAGRIWLNASGASANQGTMLYHGIENTSDTTDTTFQIQQVANGPTYTRTMYTIGYKDQYHTLSTNSLARLSIDSSGRVTMPYQPSFMAGIASTSDATIASTAYVPFNTVTGGFNTGSNFSTTNYYFTAPVAGKYLFTCAMYLTNSASSTSNMQWGFYVNGAFKSFTSGDAYGCGNAIPNSTGGIIEFATTAIYDLAANDTVGVRPRTTNIRVYQGHCYFGGYLIG